MTHAVSTDDILALIDKERLENEGILDLDDCVHEIAESDETIDASCVEGWENILNMRSIWASELNNQGVEDQIRYILARKGVSGVGDILERFALNSHAAMTIKDMIKKESR